MHAMRPTAVALSLVLAAGPVLAAAPQAPLVPHQASPMTYRLARLRAQQACQLCTCSCNSMTGICTPCTGSCTVTVGFTYSCTGTTNDLCEVVSGNCTVSGSVAGVSCSGSVGIDGTGSLTCSFDGCSVTVTYSDFGPSIGSTSGCSAFTTGPYSSLLANPLTGSSAGGNGFGTYNILAPELGQANFSQHYSTEFEDWYKQIQGQYASILSLYGQPPTPATQDYVQQHMQDSNAELQQISSGCEGSTTIAGFEAPGGEAPAVPLCGATTPALLRDPNIAPDYTADPGALQSQPANPYASLQPAPPQGPGVLDQISQAIDSAGDTAGEFLQGIVDTAQQFNNNQIVTDLTTAQSVLGQAAELAQDNPQLAQQLQSLSDQLSAAEKAGDTATAVTDMSAIYQLLKGNPDPSIEAMGDAFKDAVYDLPGGVGLGVRAMDSYATAPVALGVNAINVMTSNPPALTTGDPAFDKETGLSLMQPAQLPSQQQLIAITKGVNDNGWIQSLGSALASPFMNKAAEGYQEMGGGGGAKP